MRIFSILLIAVAVIIMWSIAIYNKLIRMIEEVNNNQKQIDVQLDRRFKVYESLIETVKKYMDYEQTTLKDVVKLRSQAQKARNSGDNSARMAAEDAISKIGGNINFLFEQYPDLKADKNALQLQEEIVNTENKLAFAKQAYNDSIEQYEAKRKSFFESMVVSIFSSKLLKEFAYWGISDSDRTEQENYKVKF
ncbi:MAG: LemA family protein [Gammaproteobacteria bacterium]|nr:LemA family protein [Gammaproteobacteria bacterium]